jgi:hypothetical protein
MRNILDQVKLRRFVKRIRLSGARYSSIALLFSASACGIGAAPHNGLLIMGSPEAIRAWNDGQTGLVSTGKASPDKLTDYHATRVAEEQEYTRRATAPGFMSQLFGGAK